MNDYVVAIYRVAKPKESSTPSEVSYIAVVPETDWIKSEWHVSDTLFGLQTKLKAASITAVVWEEAEKELAANGFYKRVNKAT